MKNFSRVSRIKKEKAEKSPSKTVRFVVFGVLMSLLFGLLLSGLFDLQIVNGDKYAQKVENRSITTITIKGTRGMITDINSVVLARSEQIYNVTFYRESNDWDYPTEMILETLDILKAYDCSL